MSELTSKADWLVLLDRLRRQAIDVIAPVLALVAAGHVTGLDWQGTLWLLAGGTLVTLLTHVSVSQGTTWWERIVITAAGSVLAVLGADWTGWIGIEWPTALWAILGSIALSLLRSGLAGPVSRPR